ncbi:MAG: DUF58 domain-containing protein [Candidatus Dormibacteria bacterium]
MSAASTTALRGQGLRRRLLSVGDRVGAALTPRAISQSLAAAQRRSGITRAGQVAIIGSVLLWLAARVVAGTAIYLFAYGALLFVVLGYVLARLTAPVLKGDRSGLFPRGNEGEQMDVEVKLTATRSVSTFVLEERVPARLGSNVRVPITRMGGGSEVTHNYSIRCARRGVYQVGPLVAVSSDPLGLSSREKVIAKPFELLVHPRVELVSDRPLTRQFEDPPIRPPVSKPWPSGLEFYGMREYKPGDDLRRIVWRATARTGKVMVREAEQGITDHITIILDTDRAAHSKDGEDLSESFEAGVRVAASLGVKHLREGYEVRCETNSGPLTRSLRGGSSQLPLLDSLSRLEMTRDSLANVLMRLVTTPRRDAHNVLITPRLGQVEAARLRLLLNTGVSILVVALLWDEENAGTMGTAAALGCQVVGVHPGQDLSTALHNQVGGAVR